MALPQERQDVDTKLCKLRDSETRTKTQEEERNQKLQQLRTQVSLRIYKANSKIYCLAFEYKIAKLTL